MALLIETVINLEAPSPSETTLFAKFSNTEFRHLSNSDNLLSFIFFIFILFTLHVENIETISFVLVSPSQDIALKVFVIFFLRSCFKIPDDRLASVKINPKVVAIFGKIIPEPFAIP